MLKSRIEYYIMESEGVITINGRRFYTTIRVEAAGMIALPEAVRELLELHAQDALEFQIEDGTIVARKLVPLSTAGCQDVADSRRLAAREAVRVR